MFNLFKAKPVVENNVHQWIEDTYAWAITHLNGEFFQEESQLILPNNDFFPGRVSSIHEMAERVFSQTVKYAGMENWPLRLVEPHKMLITEIPKLRTNQYLRGPYADFSLLPQGSNSLEVSYNGINLSSENSNYKNTIEISYNPAQVNQPQDLISSFVQILSSLLVQHAPQLPPGGKEYVPQTIDLVACFMGFGVIFSNTAFQFKGGCGSCNNRQANRQATLTELETVYCLAMFCHLKGVNKADVLPFLKSHLKSTYKAAIKQIDAQEKETEASMLLSLIKR